MEEPPDSTNPDSIEQLAQRILDKRLEAPLLFLLEASRPLQGLGSASLQVLAPLLEPCIGSARYSSLQSWLQDPTMAQRLVAALERKRG